MDSLGKRQITGKARELWESGEYLEAGKLIYKRISPMDRPAWAADILQLAYSRIPITPKVAEVIAFARLPREWYGRDTATPQKAHAIFDDVRKVTLRNEGKNRLLEMVLLLAENVAKVIYNSYGFAAPFDHDAGWWIAPCVKGIVDEVDDDIFTDEIMRALFNGDYIGLE